MDSSPNKTPDPTLDLDAIRARAHTVLGPIGTPKVRFYELEQYRSWLTDGGPLQLLAALDETSHRWEDAANTLMFAQDHNGILRADRRAAEYRAEAAEAERITFTSRLGFGDNTREGGPAAELNEIVEPIEQAFSEARDHFECAVTCEGCGERLADRVCEHCHGSGADNAACEAHLAYVECEWCAGVGKVHPGCAEKSYAELVAERDEARAALGRVQSALAGHPECDVHPDDDVVTCGWKWAVADVTAAVRGGAS